MLFNLKKCPVMHKGKGNQELSYVMGGKVLKVSEEERYSGVIMHRGAKPSRQCAEASKKVFNFRYDKKDTSYQRQGYNAKVV